MSDTLFYILAFKAFPELSLLIFLIIKDIWDLPFKEKKKNYHECFSPRQYSAFSLSEVLQKNR